jgi:outer membrane lipoprotein-sorting protein
MKKVITLLLVLVVVIGCVGLAACGGGDGGAVVDDGGSQPTNGGGDGGAVVDDGGSQPTNGGGSETANGNGGGNGNGGEESLEDILGRGAELVSVQYEAVITAPGAPQQIMQIWFKQEKIRAEVTEQGQTLVTIANLDTQVAYLYYPAMNVAYQMDFEEAPELPLADAQSIPEYEYQIIGTEIVDGKECLVVEYSVPAEQTTVRMWIWEEYGFPIRAEMTTSAGTTIAEFRNLDFGDIPDSMFELPPGVQIMSYS